MVRNGRRVGCSCCCSHFVAGPRVIGGVLALVRGRVFVIVGGERETKD